MQNGPLGIRLEVGAFIFPFASCTTWLRFPPGLLELPIILNCTCAQSRQDFLTWCRKAESVGRCVSQRRSEDNLCSLNLIFSPFSIQEWNLEVIKRIKERYCVSVSVCIFSDEIRKSSEMSDKFKMQRLETLHRTLFILLWCLLLFSSTTANALSPEFSQVCCHLVVVGVIITKFNYKILIARMDVFPDVCNILYTQLENSLPRNLHSSLPYSWRFLLNMSPYHNGHNGLPEPSILIH